MSPIQAVLNEMRPRPLAIYLGEKSISKLAAYLRGYEHAVDHLRGGRDHFLLHFGEWIEVRLQDRIHGWENAILLKSKDEADAVDNFWRLLDEFLTVNRDKDGAPKSRDAVISTALVEEIWDSIAPGVDATDLTQEQKEELDHRLEAADQDPDGGASWEEVKARLLRKQ